MRHGHRTWPLALGLGLALASMHATPGQATAESRTVFAGQEPQEKQEEKLPPKLTAWPNPKSQAELKDQVARLRQDRSKDVAAEAQKTLTAMGSCAAPLLVRSLGKEKSKAARERIRVVLASILDQQHSRLIAESFDDKSLDVRVWALITVSRTPDPGLQKAVQSHWKKLAKRGAKAEEVERYATGLCLLSVQDPQGLEPVVSATIAHWKERAPQIRGVLNGLRSAALDKALLEHLKADDRKLQSAALRLIAAGGTPATLSAVAPFLDSGNPTLRIDAINVCRMLVAGEAPLDRLPVFEAIERAKAWKAKL
ncbi:MAG: hypothetical protein CMJ98_07815 [Planctomycetes bacterium]|nr:hypothetical protein [Planctomycetota bacterium]